MVASNCMTILNAGRVSFSGMDLSRIKIPSAILCGAYLDYANFDQADLSDVKFGNAKLDTVSFQDSKMEKSIMNSFKNVSCGAKISAIQYNPKKPFIAVGCADGVIRVYNSQSLVHEFSLEGHTKNVKDISHSPDGKMLASASEDGDVKLWNVDTVSLIYDLHHGNEVNCVNFSPDGRSVVTGCYKGENLKTWSTINGREIKAFTAEYYPLRTASYSPKGHQIAFNDSHRIKIYDKHLEHRIHYIQNHESPIYHLSYSHNGTMIVTGSKDKTMSLISTPTGKVLKSFVGHTSPVQKVYFSQDDKYVVSASENGTIIVWDI